MSDKPRLSIHEMREFREELRATAAREIAAENERRRRFRLPRRRVGIVALAALVVAGGVAGGSQLISTGKPEPGPGFASRYKPGSTSPALVLIASDHAFHQPWGVQVYDSRDGQQCARVGQVRGRDLGVVQGGKFKRYTRSAAGACGRLSTSKLFYAPVISKTAPSRLLVVGRAAAPGRLVRLSYGREQHDTKVGPGGAFLFVLTSNRPTDRLRVTVYGASGHAIAG